MLRKLLNTLTRCDNYMAARIGEERWDFIMILLFCATWLFIGFLAFLLLRLLLWSNDYLAITIVALGIAWFIRCATSHRR